MSLDSAPEILPVRKGSNDMSNDQEMTREILEYLSWHPDAEDTLDGIAAWKRRTIESTRAAMEELVEQGLLLTRRTSDGEALYRLNPEKKERIQRLLNRP